jgi:UDPglucose 6-dehydrogenase
VNQKVSVVGLGKLGLCFAACFAEKGFETLGVDIEEKVVDSVNRGASPIVEPGLDVLVRKHGGTRLRATTRHDAAINETDVTFILVATPSNPDGSFSNRYVEAALESLAKALQGSKKAYHLFVISSTVAPGSTMESFIPLLERHSGRKVNEGFGVCFDPDFVALGEVIKGFLRPELIIIGESNRAAGDVVESLHRKLCENEPHIARMSIVSAEIAKVSLNAFITIKISFANTLANICEKVKGADVDAITKAVGMDRRISPYYFQAGTSFGGTCFPRDTHAFANLARKYGNPANLVEAADKVNRYQDERLAQLVLEFIRSRGENSVSVLGLAFKPNTPVITESPSIKLIQELLKHDLRIVVYDPLAIENTKVIFNDQIEYVSSAKECLEASSLSIIMTREAEYKACVESYSGSKLISVVDCWRLVQPARLNGNIRYIPWGHFYDPNTKYG